MSYQDISQTQWENYQRLRDDHLFFARHIQKIEPKDIEETEDLRGLVQALTGSDSLQGLIPLLPRPGQAKLSHFVELQMQERGFARTACVKPRQVGWSTIIQSRAHWRANKTKGLKIQIISHNDASTKRFLRRARKMCAASPPTVTPGRQIENSNILEFDNGASWAIATAGSPDAVRSDNCHFLHVSEESSFKDSVNLMAAVLPSLSDARGSEAYRESTSKGKGNEWHRFIEECQDEKKHSLWRVFFDAWFNQPTYRMTPPPGWQPDDEGAFLMRKYDLDLAQMFWRAMKIQELRAVWMFKQEFPCTIDESFQASADTLYPPDAIYKAADNGKNNRISRDPFAPLIMGVDPARNGDRTVIVFRQGNMILAVLVFEKMVDERLTSIIADFLVKGYQGVKVAKCFIDYAIGEGVASQLRTLGQRDRVTVVNFGGAARDPRYLNKRTEMYMDMRDWFGDTGEQVSICFTSQVEQDQITGDLLAIPDFEQQRTTDKICLVPKADIKKNYGRSPDIADACALTFAFPVAHERPAGLIQLVQNELARATPNDLSAILQDFI